MSTILIATGISIGGVVGIAVSVLVIIISLLWMVCLCFICKFAVIILLVPASDAYKEFYWESL